MDPDLEGCIRGVRGGRGGGLGVRTPPPLLRDPKLHNQLGVQLCDSLQEGLCVSELQYTRPPSNLPISTLIYKNNERKEGTTNEPIKQKKRVVGVDVAKE